MNALYYFLVWLTTYAPHFTWLAEVGHYPAPIHVVYGGNFVQAYEVAHALGGFVSQVVR